MTVRILDMPDVTQLAAWLERELVGIRLGNLVRELCAVHELRPAIADESRLHEWLEDDRSRLLADGLSSIPITKLRQLLVRPELLLPLQELVLVEGGLHWQKILEQVAREENYVPPTPPSILELEVSGPTGVVSPAPLSTKTSSKGKPASRILTWSLASAAAVLVAVGLLAYRGANGNPTWGWNDPDLLAAKPNESSADHFRSLGNAANAWFNQPRETSEELAARLQELREGCDRLIADPHPALAPVDRQWLVDVCREWRNKFDQQVAALDHGKPVAEVRGEMDSIMHNVVKKLQNRGKDQST